jgi:hypothetical protein
MAATAQSNHGTASQAERLSFHVGNRELAFHANRSVIVNSDLSWHQESILTDTGATCL